MAQPGLHEVQNCSAEISGAQWKNSRPAKDPIMTYILTGPASLDLDEILDHIAAQSVQTAGRDAGQAIRKGLLNRIASNSGIGP